eukprot:1153998-Prymnesium_polylepis.2
MSSLASHTEGHSHAEAHELNLPTTALPSSCTSHPIRTRVHTARRESRISATVQASWWNRGGPHSPTGEEAGAP